MAQAAVAEAEAATAMKDAARASAVRAAEEEA
jgi:hypothetical protein